MASPTALLDQREPLVHRGVVRSDRLPVDRRRRMEDGFPHNLLGLILRHAEDDLVGLADPNVVELSQFGECLLFRPSSTRLLDEPL